LAPFIKSAGLNFVFMLVIRFARVGRKNKPQFRIVVQEHTATPTGKHTEIVGSWDPNQKKGAFKNERIEHWIGRGAQVSDSVHNLLVSQEVIKGDKRKIKISKKKTKEEESEKSQSSKDDGAEEKKEESSKEPSKDESEEKKEEPSKEEPETKEDASKQSPKDDGTGEKPSKAKSGK